MFEFFKIDSAQYYTARSQALRSIILHRVTIQRGVNSHFFKILHRPLQGQFHKIKYIFRICFKRTTMLIFALMFQGEIFFLLHAV